MNRLQVFHPESRDNLEREVCVPDSVKKAQELGLKKKKLRTGYAPTKDDFIDDDDMDMEDGTHKKTARDLMWENGGPGVWAPDYRESYDLKDPEWRFDAIPEILDGKNIMDYVDPDIDAKLAVLEKEEEQLAAEAEAAAMGDDESDLDEEEEAAVEAIRERKKEFRMMSHANKSENKPMMPRAIRGRPKDKHDRGVLDSETIRKKMEGYGVDTSDMLENRKRGRSVERRLMKALPEDSKDEMDMDGLSKKQAKKQRKENSSKFARDVSRARSHTRPREPSQVGLKDEAAVALAKKLDKEGRTMWEGLSGEGDQRKSVHLVKWMNTGKKRNGTTNKR
jgi:nucleolar GTP-binding protein